MSRRFQFSLRSLLVAMLVVAAFIAGVRFERERRRRADEAASLKTIFIPLIIENEEESLLGLPEVDR